MPTPYPPAPPTVSGANITVDAFLRNPTRVTRAIEALTLNRFFADQIFSAGPPAEGGAVIYDQITEGEFFTDRDVQAIEPLAEFPIVNSGEHTPLVAAVTKWGGAVELSEEAIRRDRRDVLARELTRLRNTLVRKIDAVALAVLNAAPIQTDTASDDWTGGNNLDIIADLEGARTAIDEQDMGYIADTVILNPAQALDLRTDPDVRAAMPRENMATNMLGAPDLSGFLRFPNWYVTNRQTAGTIHVLASRQVGSISDEVPVYSRVVVDDLRERRVIQAARVPAIYVTDPKACIKITGA